MSAVDQAKRQLPKTYKVGQNKFITALLEVIGELDDQVRADIVQAKNQLFVTLASGQYLEALGAGKGVEKPSAAILNLSDDDFRKLIPVLSTFPKQVRSTMNDLLDVFYGPLFSRANLTGTEPEFYNMGALVSLSGQVNIQANSLDVTGIGTSFLSEVQPGDYIRAQNQTNAVFVKVSRIISNNELTLAGRYKGKTFTGPAVRNTPKTLSIQTESGVENIDISPAFMANTAAASATEITAAINYVAKNFTAGTLKDAFAQEILVNVRTDTVGPLGFIQVLSGTAVSIIGFPGNKVDVQSLPIKTIIYEINPREIVIRLPSGVPAVRRDLKGSIHFHGNYEGLVTAVDNGAKTITVNFDNFVPSGFHDGQLFSQQLHEFTMVSSTGGTTGVVLNFSAFDDLSGVMTGKRFAILDKIRANRFVGSFIYDPENVNFTITRLRTTLGQVIEQGDILPQIVVDDASNIPDTPGVLVFDFGKSQEEQPVKYLARPNNSTLLLDPTHTFTKDHAIGEILNVILLQAPAPSTDGLDYAVYIVGVDEARAKIQDLVRQIKAAGVVVRFIIEFPEYLFPVC